MDRAAAVPSEQVTAVRRFNRFYTRQIGLLGEAILASRFSLTEARVLYELAHHDRLIAADLGKALRLDAGYLSRILKRFESEGLIGRAPSAVDARQAVVTLAPAGRAAFSRLDQASEREIGSLLARLPADRRASLTAAMAVIQEILDEAVASDGACRLREHRIGDIGWVVARQAVLYATECGWDQTFEALLAEIGGAFLRRFDPTGERCWIAERHGQIVGSVCVARQSERIAKLRLLYVEPSARGLGLGRRLVDEAVGFARAKGYVVLTLWTNDVLVAARRIYEGAGFRLIAEEPHRSFGKDLVGQTWQMDLDRA